MITIGFVWSLTALTESCCRISPFHTEHQLGSRFLIEMPSRLALPILQNYLAYCKSIRYRNKFYCEWLERLLVITGIENGEVVYPRLCASPGLSWRIFFSEILSSRLWRFASFSGTHESSFL
jgi:hypothetical protein